MSSADKLKRHTRLMSRMADQNGAELKLAQQVGLLSSEEFDEAARSCTECSDVEGCEGHLDGGSSGIPEYCRNGDMLRRLAGDMEQLGLTDPK